MCLRASLVRAFIPRRAGHGTRVLSPLLSAMPASDHSTHVTLEVLDTRLDHLQDMLKQVLEQLRGAASKTDLEELRAQIRALETRLKPLEEDRTAARAILAILSLLGMGGVGVILKWLIQG